MSKCSIPSLFLALAFSAGILCNSRPSIAKPESPKLKEIIFRYGILEEKVTIKELEDFANNGTIPRGFELYIRRIAPNPTEVNQLRELLNRELPVMVDLNLLDRALNMPLGEIILDKLGEVIHTPAKVANRQALRAALITSARSDAKISLLELIKQYPTQEIHVDLSRLSSAYRDFTISIDQQRLIDLLQSF